MDLGNNSPTQTVSHIADNRHRSPLWKTVIRDTLTEKVFNPDGSFYFSFSWSRIQSVIAFFFFLVFYTKQTWNTHTIPEIPDGWIFLIGVSSATYLVAKYSAMSQYRGMFPSGGSMGSPFGGFGNTYYPTNGAQPIYNGPNNSAHMSQQINVGGAQNLTPPQGQIPPTNETFPKIPGPDGPSEVRLNREGT